MEAVDDAFRQAKTQNDLLRKALREGDDDVNDTEKQRVYEQRRSKSRPAAMASYTTTEYRIYRPGHDVFTERAIGPSQIVAYYPDFLRIEIVGSEPVCAECPAAGGFY